MKTHEQVSVGLEEKMEQLAEERKRATTQVETHESEAAALNSKLQDLQKQLGDIKEQAVQDDGQQEMVSTLKTELEEATRTAASSNTEAGSTDGLFGWLFVGVFVRVVFFVSSVANILPVYCVFCVTAGLLHCHVLCCLLFHRTCSGKCLLRSHVRWRPTGW